MGWRRPRERPIPRIQAARKEISLQVRTFDEADADRQVVAYCTKRIADPKGAQGVIDTFRKMRKTLAPRQGETRKTWVQAIVLGDVAIVGVPGEFFTLLGQEIKRRSPYRYTFVFELANDYVGYIPDAPGLRSRRLSGLDGPAQFSGEGQRRDHRRRGRWTAQSIARERGSGCLPVIPGWCVSKTAAVR